MNKKYKLLGIMIGSLLAISVNAKPKTLVYCSEGSPENFTPAVYTSGTSVDASSGTIYNRLVEFKPGETTLSPSLAESWEISDDGLLYTFHLRKGVEFHSNKLFTPSREFNADDVIFSFMRQKDKDHPYYKVTSGGVYSNFESLQFGELIQDIKKIDDHTVQFVLSHADAPFLGTLAWYFAAIGSAEYAEKMLAEGKPDLIDSNPIGTGPFQFLRYQKDSNIMYQAFPKYWEGKAPVDRLVFSITPDASIRYAKLQKGECQVMPFPNPADIARMKTNPNLKVLNAQGLNIGFLAFNTQKVPFDNVKVRQALSMAIDKASIMDAIFQGTAIPAKNLLPPNIAAANDDIVDYKFEPEAAKKLLAEAGYPNGLKIDLWAPPVQRPYNPNARRMAEMIQSDWEKIGVTANVVTFEWGEYLSRVRNGEHQTALMGWTTATGDPDNFYGPLFSCQSAINGSNSSKWCYKPFDDLLAEAKVVQDPQKRIDIYRQAQVIMHEQAPAFMIAHARILEPVRKEVENYRVDPFGRHMFYGVSLSDN